MMTSRDTQHRISNSPVTAQRTMITTAMAPRTLNESCDVPQKPKSILRQPTFGSGTVGLHGEANDNISSSSSCFSSSSTTMPVPSHWPIARSTLSTHFTARFPDDPISSIRFRPRTPPEDIPNFFYSAQDVKRFKGEYHQLVLSKGLLNRRGRTMTRSSSASATTRQEEKKSRMVQQATNTHTARRQVHPNAYRRTECSQDGTSNDVVVNSYRERSSYCDPLNNGSRDLGSDEVSEVGVHEQQPPLASFVGSRGILSSTLFDMAREAVSAWNGANSSGSIGQHRRRRPSNTTVQLVDTMYLF